MNKKKWTPSSMGKKGWKIRKNKEIVRDAKGRFKRLSTPTYGHSERLGVD